MSALDRVALLVEDEPLIAMLAASILRDLGYTVFEARSKDEAHTVLAAESSIKLILTDVQLADGSSGADLAFEIAATYPHIKLIVTSGRRRPVHLPEGTQFLPKPYTGRHLAKALHA